MSQILRQKAAIMRSGKTVIYQYVADAVSTENGRKQLYSFLENETTGEKTRNELSKLFESVRTRFEEGLDAKADHLRRIAYGISSQTSLNWANKDDVTITKHKDVVDRMNLIIDCMQEHPDLSEHNGLKDKFTVDDFEDPPNFDSEYIIQFGRKLGIVPEGDTPDWIEIQKIIDTELWLTPKKENGYYIDSAATNSANPANTLINLYLTFHVAVNNAGDHVILQSALRVRYKIALKKNPKISIMRCKLNLPNMEREAGSDSYFQYFGRLVQKHNLTNYWSFEELDLDTSDSNGPVYPDFANIMTDTTLPVMEGIYTSVKPHPNRVPYSSPMLVVKIEYPNDFLLEYKSVRSHMRDNLRLYANADQMSKELRKNFNKPCNDKSSKVMLDEHAIKKICDKFKIRTKDDGSGEPMDDQGSQHHHAFGQSLPHTNKKQ